MNTGFDHFPEETWEAYSMGTLSGKDCQLVEEHLLICPACQDLLAEADETIQVAKAALLRTRQTLSKPVSAAVALAVALLFFQLP
jgi:predicted anti-sigma-YlaC factor YlaD